MMMPEWKAQESVDSRAIRKAARREDAHGVVYFFEATGIPLVKIGWSKNDGHDRVRACQVGCPIELRLLAVVFCHQEFESEVHARFNHLRVCPFNRSSEWFAKTPELVRYIELANRLEPENMHNRINEAALQIEQIRVEATTA